MASTTETKNYKFNHSMLRVKDPKESVKFYSFLGMSLIQKLEFPDAKFDLYFLGYDSAKAASGGRNVWDREGLIELTHNYGTETDAEYKINNGNVEPHRGFGHTCISVDNIQAACQRIEDAGYKFQKKLSDGRMRHIAFALDPDGYWVEIIGQKPVEETENVKETDVETYRMGQGTADREGLLELTWNHGTEKDADFKYHDGNSQPQGFGHICVSVDNIEAACARLESLNVNWKKRLTDGRMKNVAFILDPDGYWVELVQNERLSGKANF
ncbi:hypothetical protein NEMBOFW57_008865 [Staphylotrichum longicolle]|uniref:lactoylglutathione lyase n=1 Tax=Staphylotrichum longicolle TaxID=669026 RepID=A0AAD4ESK7_9PEZI|nr:hypothetical protein NEMBOFW57_008865 [Staphylotrichum longicolle]